MSERVGVLGGAFNPPHVGHLVLADEAIGALDLERLLVVPTGRAPHKRIDPEPGPELRLALAEAAFGGLGGAEVSEIEVAREGPSYTYRTLESLADELPRSELILVMGADVAAGLESWRRPERVLGLAQVAIAARPGADLGVVDSVLERLHAPRAAVRVAMPEIGVSSTLIRERVAAGRSIRNLVPPAVAELIAERRLYGSEVAA